MVTSYLRGHPIYWDGYAWRYQDDGEPLPGWGGGVRPCARCGLIFGGSFDGEADPCLGVLPGVDNACCGHGVREQAYVRFTNGVTVRGFDVVEIAGEDCCREHW